MARVGYDDESTPLVVTTSQSITNDATGTASGTSTMVERVANIVGAIVGFVTIMAIVGFLGDASGSIRSGKAALVHDNWVWDINMTLFDVELIKRMSYKPGTFCAESDTCGISIDQCASMIETKQQPPEGTCPSFNYQQCCVDLKKFCKCDAGDSASSSMAALVQTSYGNDWGSIRSSKAPLVHDVWTVDLIKGLGYEPDVFCAELDMCVRSEDKCDMILKTEKADDWCPAFEFQYCCHELKEFCNCDP